MGEGLYMDEPFPWYFISDMTYNDGGDNQGRCGFTHYFANEDDGIISDFHSLFIKLIQNSCQKIKVKKVDVLQARSFFQLPTNIPKEQVDVAHIDLIDTDHFVMLYYVCNSDGDTLIYNEKSKSDIYTLQRRVTPQQGRVVLFDGSYYHTGEQPLNNVRCVVNYNLR